jgi:glutamyl-tRNA reductase
MASQIWAAEIFTSKLSEETRQKLFTVRQNVRPAFGNRRRGFEEVFVAATDSQFVVYGVGQKIDPMLNFFLQDPALFEHVHFYKSTEASINHLFAITTGLCADIKGSRKASSDIAEAHYSALHAGGLGLILDNAVRQALRVSRKVREATEMDQLGTLMVNAGMDIVSNRFEEPNDLSYLVIGTGDIARSCLEFFYHAGFRNVKIVSQDHAAAKKLAREFSATTIELDQIQIFFQFADVVIAEENFNDFISSVVSSRPGSSGRKKMLFDFSSGIPKEIRNDSSLEIYTVEDINNSPSANASVYHSLEEAWKMVEVETSFFLTVLDDLGAAPGLTECWSRIVSRGEQGLTLLKERARLAKGLDLIRFYNTTLMRSVPQDDVLALLCREQKATSPASCIVLEPYSKSRIYSYCGHLN